MHSPRWIRLAVVVGSLAAALSARPALAIERSAADLMPATTVFYAEIPSPKSLLDVVLDHPFRAHLEAQEDFRKALQTPQYLGFRFVVGIFEAQTGMPWRKSIETLAEDGIYMGFDPQTEGVMLIVKSADAKALEKARDGLINMARRGATLQGRPDPVRSAKYRGLTRYIAEQAHVITLGPWLIVTNKEPLANEAVDNLLDDGRPTLAGVEHFRQARATRPEKVTAWGYVSLDAVRSLDKSGKLAAGKTDNPAAELLFGGVAANLAKTPYATATLQAAADRLELTFSTPHQSEWTASREFFFGPQGKGAAPALLQPRETFVSLSAYRNLPGLWGAAPDLFDENINAQLAQADSGLSTFFSGRDFGQEILTLFQPEIQLVSARQTFPAGDPLEPAIKLPATALVFQVRDLDKMERNLRISFQSALGLANIAGAQAGQPQLEMHDAAHGSGRIIWGQYFVDNPEQDKQPGKINYNFSPAMAVVGDRLIFSSTHGLAKELIDLLSAPPSEQTAAEGPVTNFRLEMYAPVLREMLRDNRQHLIAQNVLEKGHDRSQAEREIEGLLALLGWIRDLSVQLENDGQQLQLRFGLDISPPQTQN